jgi:arsenate reductase
MAKTAPVMYGIPNCNTIKKARAWLEQHDIDYEFHDYKKMGTDESLLTRWIKTFGWDKVVNTRGTTWRKLDEAVRDHMDDNGAVKIMMEKPSIIKRPILVVGKHEILGFDEDSYRKEFKVS